MTEVTPFALTLEKYLQDNIPISSALGVSVNLVSSDRVILRAPFVKNINHKQTVFGGSLHAVATLACWSLLHIKMLTLFGGNVQIVIAKSEVKYLLPVVTDFNAECCKPDPEKWEHFVKIFEKKGKGRLTLQAKILQENDLAVDYEGVFVAIRTLHPAQNEFENKLS